MADVFWTADHHYRHFNIIKHCNRPFSSSEEMDEVMIQNWNNVVKPNDTVYYLGDLVYGVFRGYVDAVESTLKRLNGRIELILGNHDKKLYRSDKFVWVGYYKLIKLDGIKFVLCHYPFESWDGSCHGSIHCHGHSHGRSAYKQNRFDVGVDCWNFTPVSYEILRDYLENSP